MWQGKGLMSTKEKHPTWKGATKIALGMVKGPLNVERPLQGGG
jgi:hypothetical protein